MADGFESDGQGAERVSEGHHLDLAHDPGNALDGCEADVAERFCDTLHFGSIKRPRCS